MPKSEIDKWSVPDWWHPDFGDAAAELEMLKAFSQRLVHTTKQYSATLRAIEDGYLDVFINMTNDHFRELKSQQWKCTSFGTLVTGLPMIERILIRYHFPKCAKSLLIILTWSQRRNC